MNNDKSDNRPIKVELVQQPLPDWVKWMFALSIGMSIIMMLMVWM